MPKIADLAAANGLPKITDLPFVADRNGKKLPKAKRGEMPRCFWNVSPTGDYSVDCRTGAAFALAFLDYESVCYAGGMLQLIVGDMLRRPFTGIEIGFLSTVSWAAARGRQGAYDLIAHQARAMAEITAKSRGGARG